MKKRSFKSLSLNKKSISKLFGAGPTGNGGTIVTFNTLQINCPPTGPSEVGNMTICVRYTCECPPDDKISDVPDVC